MKFSMSGFLMLFTCLFASGLNAQENTVVDRSTRESFPSEVSFEANGKQYDLQATGVATRKKMIVKVYSVAHYLQKGISKSNYADKLQSIMSDDTAKQLSIKWLRDIGADKVQGGFEESFHKVLQGQGYAHLKGEINNFLQFFNQGVRKGDESVIRWLPGGYVEVLLNGTKVGSLTSADFAKALWSIWFGQNSVVNRNDLISQMR